eukprot:scaffold95760_cov20-Tisochrysis_lutea.AAC.1
MQSSQKSSVKPGPMPLSHTHGEYLSGARCPIRWQLLGAVDLAQWCQRAFEGTATCPGMCVR